MRKGKVGISGRHVFVTSLKLGPDLTGHPSGSTFPILTMTPWKIIFMLGKNAWNNHFLVLDIKQVYIGILISYRSCKRLFKNILFWHLSKLEASWMNNYFDVAQSIGAISRILRSSLYFWRLYRALGVLWLEILQKLFISHFNKNKEFIDHLYFNVQC